MIQGLVEGYEGKGEGEVVFLRCFKRSIRALDRLKRCGGWNVRCMEERLRIGRGGVIKTCSWV